MKNPIVRILMSAILFSFFAGILVSVIGIILGWKTSTQFSDGFFWAGAIVISAGFLNLYGMYSQRTVAGLQYSQSAVHLDATERFKIWDADILRGRNLLIFLGTSGALLWGLSGLVLWVGSVFYPQ